MDKLWFTKVNKTIHRQGPVCKLKSKLQVTFKNFMCSLIDNDDLAYLNNLSSIN